MAPRPQRHVLESRLRMAGLGPQPLDQLRSRITGLRKLLARPLAERRRERVDLPHRRFSLLSHAANWSTAACKDHLAKLAAARKAK